MMQWMHNIFVQQRCIALPWCLQLLASHVQLTLCINRA
jgi:hypothetical protein